MLDAAFVFGNMGNSSDALGAGWSVEDAFAWAVGGESELCLPLPGNDRPYVLRFDVHPALFPPRVAQQSLTIRAGKTKLGSFQMKGRETIVIPLPVELTRGARHLHLTLLHPDAARPSDYDPVDDNRLLALCFHSVTCTRLRSGAPDVSDVGHAIPREAVHGLIAGDATALRICEVIGKLPSLKGRFGLRFLDLTQDPRKAVATLPPNILETSDFCWMEMSAGTPAACGSLRAMLPADCTVRTLYAPTCQTLWPFQGRDPRAVPEPGRYMPSRYPYGDQVAAALAGMNLTDDALYLLYETSAEQEPLDLDTMLKSDLRRWRGEGAKSDMPLADFIGRHIRSDRVFISPGLGSPLLLREMVERVLDDRLVHNIVRPEVLSAELDALLDGFAGWPREIPVQPLVARHFGLPWWSPGIKYRWQNNLRTHREYILDYIRWVQWRQ